MTKRSLLVVEGAHDAAFFSLLLKGRGFSVAKKLDQVPQFWRPLIPERYPVAANGRLDRVIRFPEIHWNSESDTEISVAVSGGDSQIISTLRVPLEQLDVNSFYSIGIAIDADWKISSSQRFSEMAVELGKLNLEQQSEGVQGFPIGIPESAGVASQSSPKVVMHVFPDNESAGALETVLLECAASTAKAVHDVVCQCVDDAANILGNSAGDLLSENGKLKAKAGMMANVGKPGASLAVSLLSPGWLGELSDHQLGVSRANEFLDILLS